MVAKSGSPKFIGDAMLGSLSRKLRIFGYDTLYFRDGPDSLLLALAKEEGRVVLTSDRALAAGALTEGVDAFLIEGRNDRERLGFLEAWARGKSLDLPPGVSRCALCNVPLISLKRADVAAELPPGVLRRHRVFFRCRRCGKVYWKGGHWKKLRRLSSTLPRQQT